MLSIPYVGEVDVCLKSHLNGRFLFPYAKLTRADVEIDDPFWNSCGKQNLFIDIFPLDGLPDDPSSVEHLYREALKIKNDIAKSDVGIGFEKSAFRKIAKRAYIALRGGRRWRTRSYEKMQSLWSAYPYEVRGARFSHTGELGSYPRVSIWGLHDSSRALSKIGSRAKSLQSCAKSSRETTIEL